MAYEDLSACLEQEEVLLTRIRDISVQMETQCSLPNPAPGELVQQRQVYLDRLKKCGDRVTALLGKLDPCERERLSAVLSSGVNREECSTQEAPLLERGAKCRSLLRETVALDRESLKQIKKECDRLQKLVNESRRGEKAGLFRDYVD